MSEGKDEIFDPAYQPPKLHLGADGHLAPVEKVVMDPMMLKVADAVGVSSTTRHMRFSGASKEDKLSAQIRKSEQMMEKQRVMQDKLRQ